MKSRKTQGCGGSNGESQLLTEHNNSGPRAGFMPYPKAMNILAARLGATPEELAVWVWLGPKDGGLAAYLSANELDPPPRFAYTLFEHGFDYLAPLMGCWFDVDEIANFVPTDRFITGKALIQRWSKHPGIHPESFILAKIGESRLLDAHPTCGGTQGTFPADASFPPLADGLFVLAHVEAIEARDFGSDDAGNWGAKDQGHLNHDPDLQRQANEIAALRLAETGRSVTRDKVAQLLAARLGRSVGTVLRRIRKVWP